MNLYLTIVFSVLLGAVAIVSWLLVAGGVLMWRDRDTDKGDLALFVVLFAVAVASTSGAIYLTTI